MPCAELGCFPRRRKKKKKTNHLYATEGPTGELEDKQIQCLGF